MANLPSNRTKLNVAIANQQPSIVASSQANREALVESYDTIDLLNQKVDGLVAGNLLVPFPPAGISRQAFINGNFDFWFRGTSFSATGYTADRWRLGLGSGAAVTVSQQSFAPGQTNVPNNPNFYVQIATSVVGSSYSSFEQRIEDVGTFANQKVSFGFWAKCASGTTLLQFSGYQSFGSGGSSAVGLSTATFTLTTNWQYFSGTINIPSVTGKTVGANSFLDIAFRIPTSEAANTIHIAQVQLNAGSVALPYQPMHSAVELAMCQRYFEVIGGEVIGGEAIVNVATGVCASVTQAFIPIVFSKKRIVPTVTTPTVAASNIILRGAGNYTVTSVDAATHRDTGHALLTVNASGMTAGNAVLLRFQDATAFIAIDAEL